MRDQGGGTLFSSKLSVKVGTPVRENSEARRRLNGNGGKSMQVGGTTSASSSGSGGFRLNPRSIGDGHGFYRHHQSSEELDHYNGAMDKVVKEYRRDSEPLLTLKPKATPSPPRQEESFSAGGGALPQWGLCKRSRWSRFEAAKPPPSSPIARVPESLKKAYSSIARVQESAGKAVQERAERQSNGEDRLGGQGWAARPATVDHNTKGATTAVSRIGSIRFSDNALSNHHSHGSSSPAKPLGVKERERATSLPRLEHKHRSLGSAEPPSSNDLGFTTTALNRGSFFIESAVGGSSAQPRFDLKTLEWPRISMNVSRKEKEEDFQKIKGPGSKLPQRPKKRPRAVERILQNCTPGSSLGDIVRGRYDVKEEKPVKKKPRGGLKAMDSRESDSV